MDAEPGGHTLEALIDELARVLNNAGKAREFVRRVGFVPADIPDFGTARVFWDSVVRDADAGKTVGGVEAIVELAKERFPGSPFFATYGTATSTNASAATPSSPPSGASIDNRGANIGQQIFIQGNGIFGPGSPSIGREEPERFTSTSSPPAATASASEAVDVVLLTALHEEYLAVLDVDDGAIDPQWVQAPRGPFERLVAQRRFRGADGSAITVLATWAEDMAGNATAGIGGMLCEKFKPRCLAMTGIAAGPRGKVELGDVVFGRCLFTHDTGKVSAKGEGAERTVTFKGDPNAYRLRPDWKQRVEVFKAEHNRRLERTPADWARDKPLTLERQGQWVLGELLAKRNPREHAELTTRCPDWEGTIKRLLKLKLLRKNVLELTERGRGRACEHALLRPSGPGPVPPVRVHMGDIASGNPVVEDAEIFARIEKSMRKTIGLEMEAAAIASVAELGRVPWVVAKAICDFGDDDKDDRFHAFAGRASAECLLAFLREHVDLLGPRGGGRAVGGATGEGATGETATSNHRGTESPTVATTPPTVPLWEAVPELKRILADAPRPFVDALGRALGVPSEVAEVDAERVAVAVDGLGSGPAVAKRLLDACVDARIEVRKSHPEQLRAASSAALLLSAAWLPRRYGDGAQAWLLKRQAGVDRDCPAIAVATKDPIMTDVHVSGVEGVRSEVRVIRRMEDGETCYSFIGVRRFPAPGGALGEIKSAHEVGRAVAEGYAKKFGLSPRSDPEYVHTLMNSYLSLRRKDGDPKHVVVGPEISRETLEQLELRYPALRMVMAAEQVDYFEAEIVPILAEFLVQADESGPNRA